MAMRLKTALIGVLAGTVPSTVALAAPATPDQAQSIKTALERYLGHGDPQGPGPVSVTPAGDGYTIAIDIKNALHALESVGVLIDPTSESMTAAPQPDGTWHVTSGGQQKLTAHFKDQTFGIVVNGLHYDGVLDPRIPAFTGSTATYDSTSIATVDGTGGTQTFLRQQGKQVLTTAPAGDGVLDLKVDETHAAMTRDMTFDTPASAAESGQEVSLKSDATRTTASIEGLHVRDLSDLWAFAVAHPSKAALVASQSELRDLLRRALPVFKHLAQGGSVDAITVKTPLGIFAAQHASGQLDVDGLSADGHLATEAKVDGLAIPAGLVPPWAADLLPTAVAFKQTFSGYRLDTAATDAINSFDLGAPEPFSPEALGRLRTLVGPLDAMTLAIAPSRITSKLLDLRFEGDIRFAQPMPDTHMTIHATGLDGAIRDVQAKAGPDKSAAQITALMVMAKGYGKAEADGSLTWVIATDGASGITVNGVALPIGPGK